MGLLVVWSRARLGHHHWPRRLLPASVRTGWGIFNRTEGLIDHRILGIST